MRRRGNYILINIRKSRFRHWNKQMKTKKPEQSAPSQFLIDSVAGQCREFLPSQAKELAHEGAN
jgi:hypothetical protein